MHLDVVFAADPRFPGGTSTATRMDIRTIRRMGLSVGLLTVRAMPLPAQRDTNSALRATIESEGIARLTADSPVSCDLLLVEHPMLFMHMADRPTAIRPRAAVLVANHPPRLAFTEAPPEYDPSVVLDNIERIFGADAQIAPVSGRVRDLIAETGIAARRMTPVDLPRIVDMDEWALPIRPPSPDRPVVIGRHGRPDANKWPDSTGEILAAYPDRADVRVHVLGGGPPSYLIDRSPPNWRIRPFNGDHPATFLEDVDFFVYFHSRAWIEAFGLAPLEAMAAGRVVILSPDFRDQFGDGALYGTPATSMGIVDRLRSDPAAYVAQAEKARAIAADRYSFPALERQFDALRAHVGLPVRITAASVPAPPVIPLRKRRLMLISSNGVGLGHLTRLAAIARRLPEHVEPVFWTLSQGAGLLRQFGFGADYLPSHQLRGLDNTSWNRALAQEFAAALEFHAPDAVVFDGSVPYAGLVEVLDARPGLTSIWVRRALWKIGQSESALERSRHFDIIIEPADLAAREDVGITTMVRTSAVSVPPVLLLDPSEGLNRSEARTALDLPGDGRVVGIQLGVVGDTDLSALRATLLDRLNHLSCTVVEIRSPLASGNSEHGFAEGVMRRRVYPLARHLAAFDLMITEAGYNSFHEAIFSGPPTIFVPRDSPGMDDQALRAAWATSAGLGFMLRRHQTGRLGALLDRALDPATAAEIRRRADRLEFSNGAADAALIIVEAMAMYRADRPLGFAIDR